MPNKKKQRNGFYFYMKDKQTELSRQGKFVKMEELPSYCHSSWGVLSDVVKEHYNKRAKNYKEHIKLTGEGKRDCFGLPIQYARQKADAIRNKHENMVKDIKWQMQKLGCMAAIAKQRFYIISFNITCKTDYGFYIPCEVGVVEFSIEKGVISQYHEFIDPGQLPEGYKYTCIEKSESSHGIPIQNFDLASDSYAIIYEELKHFIKPNLLSKSCCQVYAFEDNKVETEQCLNWLHNKSGDPYDMLFEVYDLVTLFVELRKAAAVETGESDIAIFDGLAREFLTKSIYDYQPEIGCKWHDDEDRAFCCALGVAKRYCFFMADNLCDIYEVPMIPGKHLPIDDRDESAAEAVQGVHKKDDRNFAPLRKFQFPKPSNCVGRSIRKSESGSEECPEQRDGVSSEFFEQKKFNCYSVARLNDSFQKFKINKEAQTIDSSNSSEYSYNIRKGLTPNRDTYFSTQIVGLQDKLHLAGYGRGRGRCNQQQ